MRKITYSLLAGFVLFSVAGNAQKASHSATAPAMPNSTCSGLSLAPINEKLAPLPQPENQFDTIFYEDFVNGFNGKGTNGTWTTVDSAANFCPWKFTKNGPKGQYSTNVGVLKSTSGANGYMILDDDSANTLSGGGTGTTQANAYLTSPTINLSTRPDVMLNFQHALRYCCSNATIVLTVQVSGDGGATWTTWDVRDGYTANQTLPNATKKQINISAVAGGKSNVKIRFHKTGGSHYYWMVDDVLLTVPANNEIVLKQRYFDQDAYGRIGYYSQTPKTQVCPATFRGYVLNNGANNETNVQLKVNITNTVTSVYNQASPGVTVNKLTSDTLKLLTPAFTSTTVGTYTCAFNVTMTNTDDVPSNNTSSCNFAITDTVFARDNNQPGVSWMGPQGWVGGNQDGAMVGTTYTMEKQAFLNSMTVYVDSTCKSGTSITGHVYDYDPNASTNFVGAERMATDVYNINGNADRKKWVTLPFLGKDGTVDKLDSGQAVAVAIEVAGTNSATATYVQVGNDATTFHNDYYVSLVKVYSGGSWQWFYITFNPYIRLNIAKSTSAVNELSKNGLKVFQNQPNPAKDFTNVYYELDKSSGVSVKVYDVTGKELMSYNQGNESAGQHMMTLNTSTLSTGVYYYTFIAGDRQVTQKMTVVK